MAARAMPAILGLVAVVALGWVLLGPGAPAPVGACATAVPLPFDRSTPIDDPPLLVEWIDGTVVSAADDFDEEILLDVAAFRDGFVAIGRRANGPISHAFVLTSVNGEAWSEDPADPDRFDETELTRLAVVGNRLFAIGSTATDDRGGSRATVWFTDDGRSWSEASGPFGDRWASALAGRHGELLLTGAMGSSEALVAWRSVDGAAWEEHAVDLPVAVAHARFADIRSTAEGWLAVGSIARDVDAPSEAVLWRSDDGVAWSCALLDDGGLDRAWADRFLQTSDGAMIVGGGSPGCGLAASCIGHSLVWAAVTDGWTAAIRGGRGDPVHVNAAYGVAAEGFLAASGGALSRSPDGARWERVDSAPPAPPVIGEAGAVVVAGERVLIAGTRYGGSNADAWMAVGRLSEP